MSSITHYIPYKYYDYKIYGMQTTLNIIILNIYKGENTLKISS